MKVIQKGRKQKGWAKKIACTGKGHGQGGCGAILLVEEADIYATGSGEDGDEYHRTFSCPECGTKTNFADSEVPDHIWNDTQNKKGLEA